MKLLKLLKLKVCLWEEFHAWPLGGSNRGLGFMVSLLCKSKKHLSMFILLVSESIKKHPERNQVSPRLTSTSARLPHLGLALQREPRGRVR